MKRYILHFESSYNVRCELKDIVSHHLQLVIRNDEELKKLFSSLRQ
jgi:hypothetical protein